MKSTQDIVKRQYRSGKRIVSVAPDVLEEKRRVPHATHQSVEVEKWWGGGSSAHRGRNAGRVVNQKGSTKREKLTSPCHRFSLRRLLPRFCLTLLHFTLN